ncbi:hypothetical protein ES319_A02G075900v1 [Gossypium barbadense]|uniref:Ribosomal protein L13 n=2 Tax=Gossypium TaxID=3633 RepID=A0A5J5WPI4_GOSBA|nr:hypothetical protein ES319_A02G075900v1 [Gossypium barbadense]TYH27652.1 hypothetical protein ES288_A02G084600v1 [Gossypium darwinii]
MIFPFPSPSPSLFLPLPLPPSFSDIWNNTWYPKAKDHINTEKTWYVVDATDKILGRLASTIAVHIHGKNLATYTPTIDMGAFVIVKRTQKLYRRHSGRPGGMKVETFNQLQQRIPERIIEHAIRGMLPKGRFAEIMEWSDQPSVKVAVTIDASVVLKLVMERLME